MSLVVVLDDWEGRWAASAELAELRDVASIRIFLDHLSSEDVAREASGVDVLVINRERTRIDADFLKALPRLRTIVNTGSGLAHIDLTTTEAAGIQVLTTGGYAGAVVEQTFALMLAAVKRLPQLDRELRAGTFAERPIVGDLAGKRLGIAGLGHIGRGVARIAGAFGMHVAAWGRHLEADDARALGIARRASLLELGAGSDVFSIHLRLTPETRGIVSAEVIDALPEGAVFVNTARAELTDTSALLARAARDELLLALDVYEGEPHIDPRYAEYAAALSPHVGWKSEATWARFLHEGVRLVAQALAGPV